MDSGAILLLTLSFSVVFILIQRSEKQRRRIVVFSMVLVVGVIVWYSINREIVREAALSFFLGRAVSYLFWLLIGRYNPVGSSDNIRVLGMDD